MGIAKRVRLILSWARVSTEFPAKLPADLLAKELAEREGFELGRVTRGISKLLMNKGGDVPSNPQRSPHLPPDLPPRALA
jgi:hypothetical protein